MPEWVGGILAFLAIFGIVYLLASLKDKLAARAEKDRRKRLGLPEDESPDAN